MIKRTDLTNILFFNIETQININIEEIKVQKFILDKFRININEIDSNRLKYYAEFSKIKSISIGKIFYDLKEEKYKRYSKKYKSDDEKEVLNMFHNVCKKQIEKNSKIVLGGHNIEKVDIPFLIKRFLINEKNIPLYLDFTSYKSWNETIFDTLKVWDLMGFSQTSLDLLYYTLFNKSVEDNMEAILDLTELLVNRYNG